MIVYYKATRPDGTSFRDKTTRWDVGATVEVSSSTRKTRAECCSNSVLHASVVPHGTLIGGSWPCRLFEVTGRPVAEEGDKRGFRKLTVLREIDAHLALGAQGAQLADLIGQAGRLSESQAVDLHAARGAAWGAAWDAAWYAARDAAWGAAWDAARDAAWYAARDAAWYAARYAAWDAAWYAASALTVRDLIGQHSFTQSHYDLLTGPWAKVIGPVHPDDKPSR